MKIGALCAVVLFSCFAPGAAFAADGGVPSPDAGSHPDAAASHRDASTSTPDASRSDAASLVDASDAAPEGPSHLIGKSCTKDAECASGLTCLVASGKVLGGGAPAKGLCTKDCSTGGQAACDAVDRGSACRPFDESGKVAYCYERCVPGDAQDAPKCHNRLEMACAPNPSRPTEGYCAPTCRGDFDCGGRHCSPLTGLCVDSVDGTLGIGSACDPITNEAGTLPPNAPRCMGACLSVGAPPARDNSACTAVCSLGVMGACGEDPSSSRRPQSWCRALFPNIESTGDIGACVQLCDCDEDCGNPAFVCTTLSPLSGAGRTGECVLAGPGVSHFSCQTDSEGGTKPPPGGGGKGGNGGGGAAGSSSGGSSSAPAPAKDDSGCGCHVGGGASSPLGAASGGVLLALVLARRSSRRGRGSRAAR